MARDRKRYFQAWYQTNKERLLEGNKAYRDANKDKIRERKKAYRDANKDKIHEYQRAYRVDKKDLLKERAYRTSERYRALKNTAKRRNLVLELSMAQYMEVIEQGMCHYCGGSLPRTGHGLDRKNNEPCYNPDNVVPCCGQCNTTFMNNFNYVEKMMLASVLRKIEKLRLEQTEASDGEDRTPT